MGHSKIGGWPIRLVILTISLCTTWTIAEDCPRCIRECKAGEVTLCTPADGKEAKNQYEWEDAGVDCRSEIKSMEGQHYHCLSFGFVVDKKCGAVHTTDANNLIKVHNTAKAIAGVDQLILFGHTHTYDISCYYEGEFTKVLSINSGKETTVDVGGDPVDEHIDNTQQGWTFDDPNSAVGGGIGVDGSNPVTITGPGQHNADHFYWTLNGCTYMELPPLTEALSEYTFVLDFMVSKIMQRADVVKIVSANISGVETPVMEAQRFPSPLCPGSAKSGDICCSDQIVCTDWTRIVMVQDATAQKFYTNGMLVSTVTKTVLLAIGDNFVLSSGLGTAACDAEAPVVQSVHPPNKSVGIATDTPFIITFDEDVKPVAGGLMIVSNVNLSEDFMLTMVDGEFMRTRLVENDRRLKPQTRYSVLVNPLAFIDGFGNGAPMFPAAGTWEFTTGTTTVGGEAPIHLFPPTVEGSLPVTGSTDVSQMGTIVIIYDQDFISLNPSYPLVVASGDSLSIVDPSTYDVMVDAGRLLIVPKTRWVAGALRITVPQNGVFGSESNVTNEDYVLEMNISATAPTTAAPPQLNIVTPPSVFPPSDYVGSLPLGSPVVLDFDIDIKIGTGDITITEVGGATDAETHTIAISDATKVIVIGSSVVASTEMLSEGKVYTITFPSGSVESVSDSIGTTSDIEVTWGPAAVPTPQDIIPPSAIGFLPPAGSAGVPPTASLVVIFDEASITTDTNFMPVVSTSAGIIDAKDYSVVTDGETLIITPTPTWPVDKIIHISIPSHGVVDAAGNPSDFEVLWSVTTAATSPLASNPPDLAILTPKSHYPPPSGEAPAGVPIIADFGLPVTVATGNIVITGDGYNESIDITDTTQVSVIGSTLVINPSKPTGVSTTLYKCVLPIGSVTTGTGTANTAPIVLEWGPTVDPSPPSLDKEDDITPPMVVPGGIIPANLVVDYPTASALVVIFDETAITYDLRHPIDIAGIDPSTYTVEVILSRLVITPVTVWPDNTKLLVTVSEKAIRDAAGNVNAEITFESTTTATAALGEPLLATSTSTHPENNGSDAPMGTYITAVFDQPIVRSDGGTVTVTVGGEDTVIPIEDLVQITVLDSVLLIHPVEPFEPALGYTVSFNLGALESESGVKTTSDVNIAFTSIGDTTPPKVLQRREMPRGSAVDPGQTYIVVMFSEKITNSGATGSIIITNTKSADPAKTMMLPPDKTISFGSTLVAQLTSPLEPETTYEVTANMDCVKDLAGNSYPGGYSWKFTTSGSIDKGDMDSTVDRVIVIDIPLSDDDASDIGLDVGVLITGDRNFDLVLSACSTQDCDALEASPYPVDSGVDYYFMNAAVIEGPGMWLYFESCTASPKASTITVGNPQVSVLGGVTPYCEEDTINFDQFAERDRVRGRIESFRFANEQYIYLTCTLSMCFDRNCGTAVCPATSSPPSFDYFGRRRLGADSPIIPPAGFIGRRTVSARVTNPNRRLQTGSSSESAYGPLVVPDEVSKVLDTDGVVTTLDDTTTKEKKGGASTKAISVVTAITAVALGGVAPVIL